MKYARRLTVAVHPLSDDQILLLVFDRLQTSCQVSNLSLYWHHFTIIGNVNDAMNIKAVKATASATPNPASPSKRVCLLTSLSCQTLC